MGTFLVVFIQPLLDDFLRFANRVEGPAVQATVSKNTVEAFVMSVLRRTAGVDVARFDSCLLNPFLNGRSQELGSVVTLDDAG